MLAGATEIGPLMPKIAIWNLSRALTEVLSTIRFGMLRAWIVAGLDEHRALPPRLMGQIVAQTACNQGV